MSIFKKNAADVFTQPTLEVNLNRLIDNYKQLCEIIAPAKPSAVVKDDSYGLGATMVAQALYENANCRDFWVAHAWEGQRIAALVPEANIRVLQGIGADSVDIFAKYKLIPVISSPEMLAFWKAHKIDGIKPVIHVETGLNRLGFREHEIKELSKADLKSFSMVMSHLSCADEKDHFMNQHQLDNFKQIRSRYFADLPATLSASDGAFLGQEYVFDMVRLGAAMYGINTAPYRPNQMQNVVTVRAPVLQIADLPKGDFVGYSATYRAATKRKIAIVSIGYGDGLPRSLSNTGRIYFNIQGKVNEARIIGRMSMDNVICDVTDIEGLKVGMFADIINDIYTLDDIARDAGTISYEVVSRIGKNPRYNKKYILG
ncbi:MAG: alanine racemase [Alphaproteobacteria bacterium]|nr:alanine racemase [Alphaproteobacteria bacterium]